MKFKPITFEEIGKRLSDQNLNVFHDYTVSLFIFEPDRHGRPKNGEVVPNGSGTLISCGDSFGILTAWHVYYPHLKDAERKGHCLGIPFKDGRIMSFDLSELDFITIGEPPNKEINREGPDICFIRISSSSLGMAEKLATLKGKKSFWGIDRDPSSLPVDLISEVTAYCTIGAPTRDFRSVTREHQYIYRNKTVAFIGPKDSAHVENTENFDYLDLTFTSETYNSDPGYNGLSGGGLWAFTIQSHDNGQTLSVDKICYCGIPFYQFSVTGDGYRKVRHHFVQSIYVATRKVLNQK